MLMDFHKITREKRCLYITLKQRGSTRVHLSSGLVSAEVTMGVTWGSSCGCIASQSEKPPMQSNAVDITLVKDKTNVYGNFLGFLDPAKDPSIYQQKKFRENLISKVL
jgi:hypothetical protein